MKKRAIVDKRETEWQVEEYEVEDDLFFVSGLMVTTYDWSEGYPRPVGDEWLATEVVEVMLDGSDRKLDEDERATFWAKHGPTLQQQVTDDWEASYEAFLEGARA